MTETAFTRSLPDLWENRSTNMRCVTCMYYSSYRCRRHAPTINGYPPVYPGDWCGDHRLSKEQMAEVTTH